MSAFALAAMVLQPRQLLALDAWQDATAWDAVGYTLVYGIASAAFVPRPLLGLAAGAVFGLPAGAAIALGGTLLGCLLCFLLGRALGHAALRPVIERHRVLRAADRQLAERGFTAVLLLRLLPGIPFAASNYLAALSRVRWSVFLAASAVGSMPLILLYAWAGDRATEPLSAGQLACAGVLVAAVLLLASLVRNRLTRSFAGPAPHG